MAGDLDPSNLYDALLAIPPEHYMERSSGTDTYCVCLSFDTRGPVLGSDAMRGKIVVYDSVKMCVGFDKVLSFKPEEDMTQQLEEVAGRDGSNVGEGVTFDDDELFVLPQDKIITATGSPPAIMRGSEIENT
uniref:Uncharacterized protein n=1 Tax=Trieres chinensis TaxID=1514140 RepID=A0A7S1YVK7_TRICV|mmetsp:Transcript_11501/g.24007  ORF Transcript_11501/g.24007 Transcript_11501/m.24007 type:complete len:132 (+) Transcript_11501:506-901(+)